MLHTETFSVTSIQIFTIDKIVSSMDCSYDPVKLQKKTVAGKISLCQVIRTRLFSGFCKGGAKRRPIYVNMFLLCSGYPASKTAVEFSNRFHKHQLTLDPPGKKKRSGLHCPFPTPIPETWKGFWNDSIDAMLFTALSPVPAHFCLQKSSSME